MFKQIPIYDGRYYINENGKVFNSKTQNWISNCVFQSGYVFVTLYTSHNTTKKFALHRLLANLFLPNPNNLPVVMHLDNNPLNNSLENLRWGTYKENTQQAVKDGNLLKHQKDYTLFSQTSPVTITIRGIDNIQTETQLNIQPKSIHNYVNRGTIISYGPYKGWQIKNPDLEFDNFKVKYILYHENSPVFILKNTLQEIIQLAKLDYLAISTIISYIYRNTPISKGPYKGWKIKTIK